MKVRIWDWKSMEKVPMKAKVTHKHKKPVGDPSSGIVLYKGTITRKGVRALHLVDVEM